MLTSCSSSNLMHLSVPSCFINQKIIIWIFDGWNVGYKDYMLFAIREISWCWAWHKLRLIIYKLIPCTWGFLLFAKRKLIETVCFNPLSNLNMTRPAFIDKPYIHVDMCPRKINIKNQQGWSSWQVLVTVIT